MEKAWNTMEAAHNATLESEPREGHDDFSSLVVCNSDPYSSRVHTVGHIKAGPRTEDDREFCIRRNVQPSFHCDYTKYGADTSGILTRAWCRSMQ